MSNYQVFARKYRPQTFDDVLGQDHVVRTLRNAIEQNRLAHAYLFVGPRGTGKTSTARIFAKALNGTGGPKVDFDPEEDICREIAEGVSLDVLEIDGASNNGVEQVRELREAVKFTPARGQFKIYYIDEVHMLTTAAFNALLKTLEEPPPHVKFIFATTEPNKILPTILSRCQRFDLRRIPSAIIAEQLQRIAAEEKLELEPAAAFAIAKGADGGMRDALSMLDQLVAFCGDKVGEADVLDIFGFNSLDAVADFAEQLLSRDTAAALATLHAQSEAGKDLSRLLADLITHFRHLLVAQVDPQGGSEDLSPELRKRLEEQAASVESEPLLGVIDLLAETDAKMKWAANKRLHFEIGVIKAIQALGETRLSDVIALLHEAAEAAPAPASRSGIPQAEASPSPAPIDQPAAEIGSSSPSAPPAPSGPLAGETLWLEATRRLHETRPLIDAWVRDAHFLSEQAGKLRVGFSPARSLSFESLKRHQSFIEETLTALAGGPCKLELLLSEDLPASKAPEEAPVATETAPSEPDHDSAPPRATEPTAEPAPPSVATGSPDEVSSGAATGEASQEQDFYDDPLIKSALKEFEATIVERDSP